jgi:predicted nucleic acid-binding protein
VVLVDTNILVYLLIEGDCTESARALYRRDPDWRSEAFLLVELSNVLATYVRSGALTLAQGQGLLADAQARMPALASVSHAQALTTAEEFGLSAYDARFIALARELRVKLVTEDAKLRRAVPKWTVSLEHATV